MAATKKYSAPRNNGRQPPVSQAEVTQSAALRAGFPGDCPDCRLARFGGIAGAAVGIAKFLFFLFLVFFLLALIAAGRSTG